MNLSTLLEVLPPYKIFGNSNIKIKNISDDSRKVTSGDLFVAVKGLKVDSHNLIPDAINKGAVVVIGQNKPKPEWLKRTVYVRVGKSRLALGLITSRWWGNPASKLKMVGVTGTKGKTTTAEIIFNILKSTGKKVGLISSIGAKINDANFDTGFHVTSPEPLILHKLLNSMVRVGCEYAVVEVTSHALDQERMAGIYFDIGVLTNVTHEHLDYHKTFELYREAKLKLFENSKLAILNKDDESYEFFKKNLNAKSVSYSIRKPADYQGFEIKESNTTSIKIRFDGQEKSVLTNLKGGYNIENCLAAVACANELKINPKFIKDGLKNLPQLSGHFEEVKNRKGIKIYIDFAHTPDSLEKVLGYVKKHTKGRVLSIFGCAGERDREKRKLMGAISARLADISIFTAEDPRSEDENVIISQIVKGAKKYVSNLKTKRHQLQDELASNTHEIYKIPERGEAIAFVLQKLAKSGDTLLFLGKGHEKSMAYDGVEHPWNERENIEYVLSADDRKYAVILAAGRGTRMNSNLPKVLHKIAGRPIVSYTLEHLRKANFRNIVVVIGYEKEKVISRVGPAVNYAIQKGALGTGHALGSALPYIPSYIKTILVINGDDSAFYSPKTFETVFKYHEENSATVTFVTLMKKDPFGLGRVIRDKSGNMLGIIEEKEASEAQKKIREVNIGFYVFNLDWLKENISRIRKSKVGEYYIVDLIAMAISQDKKVQAFDLGNDDQWVGVNTIEQLEEADQKMRDRIKSS